MILNKDLLSEPTRQTHDRSRGLLCRKRSTEKKDSASSAEDQSGEGRKRGRSSA